MENDVQKIDDDLNTQQILTILEENVPEKIAALEEDYYPVDISLALLSLEDEQMQEMMARIPDELLSDVVAVSEEWEQERMIDLLSFERVSQLFQYMSTDEIVDILGNVSVGLRKNFIRQIKNHSQDEIRQLLSYAPDTAGGIMTTEFISLKQSWTVEQAFAKIREISPRTEVIDTLWIVGNDKKLIGWLPIRELFLVSLDTRLEDIMETNTIMVPPFMDQEEVANLSVKYDLSVIPVVNKSQMLIGIITSDDIMDVMREEHREDMLLMGGLTETEQMDDAIWLSVKQRLPWLVINLLTAFMASFVVGMFESTIAQAASLAAAMTIITGMGGNSASQTLALVIQRIALEEISWENDKRYVIKELVLGLINGFLTGFLAAIVLYLFYRNLYLSAIVILAMMFNLVNGGFFGYFTPLLLKRLNQDPALASTIFVTTATDVLGFFIFLTLANIVLPHL